MTSDCDCTHQTNNSDQRAVSAVDLNLTSLTGSYLIYASCLQAPSMIWPIGCTYYILKYAH